MKQHTPGPWAIDHERLPNADDVVARVGGGRNNLGIAISAVGSADRHDAVWASAREACYDAVMGSTDTEELANARLIASAPELLAACKEMLEYAVEGSIAPSESIEAWVSLIAKAEGGVA